MIKEIKNNKGFSMVEVLLSISITVIFISFIIGGLIYSQESSDLSGKRTRATFIAEEGLEATRNIRDNNFANLVDGVYGLSTAGNEWNFIGTPDITEIFERTITISTINANTKLITSNVTWSQNNQRNGSVSLETYLSNWKPF